MSQNEVVVICGGGVEAGVGFAAARCLAGSGLPSLAYVRDRWQDPTGEKDRTTFVEFVASLRKT